MQNQLCLLFKSMILIFSFAFYGCSFELSRLQDDSPRVASDTRRESRLSQAERQALVPTDLFSAVFNEDLKAIDSILARDSSSLFVLNEEHHETPLGMALRLSMPEVAMKLLPFYPLQVLTHQNKRKESYLFLASQSGQVAVIEHMAQLVSRVTLLSRGLNHLDLVDEQGRYAHFVAREINTFATLERLHLGNPIEGWRVSHNSTDLEERNFLHWAAKDNRKSIVNYAVKTYCGVSAAEPGAHFFSRFIDLVGTGISNSGRFVAFQVGDLYSIGNLFVNRQDSQGRTALHYAAEGRAYLAMSELLSCGWLRPNIRDKQGDTPLHLFLKALDANLSEHPKWVKDSFTQLLTFRNSGGIHNYGGPELVRLANSEQNTAAHLAAQFRDPFFFEELQKVHRASNQDQQGRTADQLRTQWLNQMGTRR